MAVVLAVAIGLAGLISADRAVAANTLTVCSTGATYTTIQAAVNAAAVGDTIQVCDGTYAEQVLIGPGKNDLTLQSQNPLGATIKAPSTLPHTQDAAIVQVNGATNVAINGFTISGPAPPTGTGAIGYGVLIDGNGKLTLTGNRITAIRDEPMSGAQNGIAIEVGDGPTHVGTSTPGNLIATDNRIDDYQKGAVSIRQAGSTATITGNTITGAGPTATIGQNGFFVSGGTSVISNNKISGNAYAPGALSTGIAITGGQVTISGNTLNANDYGIETFLAQGTVIRSNTVTNGFYGITLFNSANVVVRTNTTADQDYDGLFAYDFASYPDSTGNQFLSNTATGVTGDGDYDCLDNTTGTATAGTANTWTNNIGDTRRPEEICSEAPLVVDLPPVIVLPPAGAGPPVAAGPPGQEVGNEIIDKMRGNQLRTCVLEVRALGPSRALIARGVAHAPAKGTGRLVVRIKIKPKGKVLLSKNFGGVVANVRALCRSTSGVLHAGVRQVRIVLLVEHRLTPPGSWVPDQPILTGIGNSFMGYLRHRMFSVRFIECDGYTATWAPSPAFPPTLSLNRAKRVCHELQRVGGAKARVRLIPHGLTNPIATNSTESGRRVNRRVFVTIVHAFVFHS